MTVSQYAVVGVSCLFPGASAPDRFWRNLMERADSRRPGTTEDFGTDPAPEPADPADPHRVYCTLGGFVSGFSFDPTGYHLEPDRLTRLDRVFQWTLHTAREALRDAGGADPQRLARTGLILGNYAFPTTSSGELCAPLWREAVLDGLRAAGTPVGPGPGPVQSSPQLPPENLWSCGTPPAVAAAALGLGGPRYAVDAACSSALYSLKLACEHLAAGHADLMLAGAVCAPDPLLIQLSFCDLRALPENGFSQPFDARSQGVITGQGAGIFAVKRLDDAHRDGDRVYAVVDGVGLSNDGFGGHLLTPTAAGQVEAYERAYAESGVPPADIGYVECHATGTPLGDATELESLSAFFGRHAAAPLLGCVKGNIGHLMTVAGFSSLLKVVLAMAHGTLPPTPGVDEPLPFPAGPLGPASIVRVAGDWPSPGGVRRAGVSAFGFGGTNAHAVLSSAAHAPLRPTPPTADPALVITGLGCHIGGLGDVRALDRAVYEGRHAFRALPTERWRGFETVRGGRLAANLPGGEPPLGGYLADFDVDAPALRVPPAELAHFNEQQLLMLKVAHEALADAGFEPPGGAAGTRPPRRRVGVVIAAETEPRGHAHRVRHDIDCFVRERLAAAGGRLSAERVHALAAAARDGVHSGIGAGEVLSYIGSVTASRISSLWNFGGPSFMVASDGDGAVRALEAAALLLRDETVEAVLVGAVDLAAGPEAVFARSLLAPLAQGEPGLSFGRATGGVRVADGAAALVVTRAPGAAARRVYARIDALRTRYPAPAADGGGAGAPARGAPDRPPVGLAARDALAAAGIQAGDVEYLEAAADGVPGHDEAELAGLSEAYARGTDGERGCALGSVTALAGNARNAAALIGVVKAVLCLSGGYLPPAPGWREPAAAHTAALERSAFYLPTQARPWLPATRRGRRFAAVSAIGAGGACTHLVLSTDRVPGAGRVANWSGGGGRLLLPVSGDAANPLLASLARYRERLTDPATDPWAVMAEAVEDPRPGRLRVVLMADGRETLLRELDQAANDLRAVCERGGTWATPAGSFFTARPLGPEAGVALVYPGAFNGYPGLGRDLFRLFPGLFPRFVERAERPAALLRHAALYPRTTVRLSERDLMACEAALLDDIGCMVTTGTSLAVLHTDLLRELLRLPVRAAFGHSLGEGSMLFALGAWERSARGDDAVGTTPLFRDELRGSKLIARRAWNLPATTPDTEIWATYVLLVEAGRARAAVADHERVYLTHVNTPGEVVIAGDPAQCRRVVAALACEAARAPANHVMHCDLLDDRAEEVRQLTRHPSRAVGDVELLTADGYRLVERFDSDSLARSVAGTLHRPIDFPRLVRTAYARGIRCFVEVGPGGTCTRWTRETLGDAEHLAVTLDRRAAPAAVTIGQALARLASHGIPVDLAPLADRPGAARVPAPAAHYRVRCGGHHVPERVRAAARAACPPEQPSARTLPAITFDGEAFDPLEDLAPTPLPARSADPSSRTLSADGLAADTALARTPQRQTGQPSARVAAQVDQRARARTAAHASQHAPGPTSRTTTEAGAAGSAAMARSRARVLVRALREQILAAQQAAAAAHRDLADQALNLLERHSRGPVTPDAGPARRVVLDEHHLRAFAVGAVADVFGPAFAEVDTYPRRVRLPAPPYLFVSRVTELNGRVGHLAPSSVRTEYDVPHGAWYAVDGQVPAAVTIEAGQCDLLLISYLGVDFRHRGRRVYRLLDSTLTFHDALPAEGQTLRYDISITRFLTSGETLLFFFGYRAYADDRLILELTDGCAGFFSHTELRDAAGIVDVERRRERRRAATSPFKPLARTPKRSLDERDLTLLAEGRVAEVFGPAHDQGGRNPSLRLPHGRLRFLDGVDLIDPTGGPRGLGKLLAGKHLEPDAWYFTCHFPDDPVLAGSLAAEGAMQLLQMYALYLGLHLCLPDARFQPITGLPTTVQVRGPITPDHREVRYEVDIVTVDLLPRPRIIADVLIHRDGKPVVAIRDMGVEIREKPGTSCHGGPDEGLRGRGGPDGRPALLNEFHMAHAARGDLATAMGEEFAIYRGRRAPHLPGGDFLFVDRAVELDGRRGALRPGAGLVTEYDSPPDAWYHRGGRDLPYCVLMETSLQAAILLGYYLGATLEVPDEEFSLRNLGGRATLLRRVDLRGQTIRHRSRLLSHTVSGDSILQSFAFELSVCGEVFYTGESQFGYFTDEALARQAGLDRGAYTAPWLERQRDLPRDAVIRVDPWSVAPASTDASPGSGARRPAADHRLDLVDHLDIVRDGGDHGLGYLLGHTRIPSDAWYFACHFHRDPVMPGSLGVEAILQSLRAYAVAAGLAREIRQPHFVTPADVPLTWKYRGQVPPDTEEIRFEAHVKRIHREPGRVLVVGDASLWKPGLRIYELTDVAVEIRSGQTVAAPNEETAR
ncbi:beta-ketoacyl synthase N-terminal-like domain-containing protein [Streptomyces celluloflavus]|uniref:beta-ketoacyl synthase N-terminal-like domain-containing protein n=1 Tax=Streptomyces celluloflavus TaxID=58344 RepID=UPI00369C7473